MVHIGEAKNGVTVGTYGLTDGGLSSTIDHNRIIGYVQPAGDKPAWILYFTIKGDAFFYTKRDDNGALLDDGMSVKGHNGNQESNQAPAPSSGESEDEEPQSSQVAQSPTP